ncbi:unannotated protein [freshwater metagenome]|uniref:Unannotated protein n=1 Tax=freshwater metagenome TaxID=449393 RepID=A0A6J7U0W4_9ZZZZ
MDATTLSLRGASPDAMIDPMVECILEALRLDGAVHADASSSIHANSIGGKELAGGLFGAIA